MGFLNWFNGLPFCAYAPAGASGYKFWFNGLPFNITSSGGGGGGNTFPALFIAP